MRWGGEPGADGGNTEAQRHRGKPEMVERNGGKSGWKEWVERVYMVERSGW